MISIREMTIALLTFSMVVMVFASGYGDMASFYFNASGSTDTSKFTRFNASFQNITGEMRGITDTVTQTKPTNPFETIYVGFVVFLGGLTIVAKTPPLIFEYMNLMIGSPEGVTFLTFEIPPAVIFFIMAVILVTVAIKILSVVFSREDI